MPIISMFYGIIIEMRFVDHNPPHIHARHGDCKAVFDLEGNMISGQVNKRDEKLVSAWVVLHKEELEINWELAKECQELIKITPLS